MRTLSLDFRDGHNAFNRIALSLKTDPHEPSQINIGCRDNILPLPHILPWCMKVNGEKSRKINLVDFKVSKLL